MLSNDTCEKLKGMGLEAFLKGLREQQQVSTAPMQICPLKSVGPCLSTSCIRISSLPSLNAL